MIKAWTSWGKRSQGSIGDIGSMFGERMWDNGDRYNMAESSQAETFRYE